MYGDDNGGFIVDTVDDAYDTQDMQGPSSTVNQVAGKTSWSSSPTKSLVMLWFVVLAIYWLLGYLFRGSRA